MDDFAFLHNASASFEEVVMSGDPSQPLPFPRGVKGRAERVDAAVYNPVTHDVLEVSNIIYERHVDGRPPDRAYWVGRKLKKMYFWGCQRMYRAKISQRCACAVGSHTRQGGGQNHVVAENSRITAH